MIRTVSGNLLDDDADALVNAVNTAGVMGKGIALQFKQTWPDVEPLIHNALTPVADDVDIRIYAPAD